MIIYDMRQLSACPAITPFLPSSFCDLYPACHQSLPRRLHRTSSRRKPHRPIWYADKGSPDRPEHTWHLRGLRVYSRKGQRPRWDVCQCYARPQRDEGTHLRYTAFGEQLWDPPTLLWTAAGNGCGIGCEVKRAKSVCYCCSNRWRMGRWP